MVAINHALTGAAIGLLVGQPWLAVPLAIVSHYLCDMLPHYHSGQPDQVLHKTLAFRLYLVGDASLCVALVVVLAVTQPVHWLLAAVCAFAATAPDFLWLNAYLTHRRGRLWQPNRFNQFAKTIQWFQRPIGAVIEIAWFIGASSIIEPWLR